MSKTVSIDELRAHKTRESFYLLLHKKVYDCTKFLDEHPGGDEVILAEAGQDGTDAFEDVGHSDEARAMLPEMLVGDFDGSVGPTKAESQSSAAAAAERAVEQGSNLMYFIPLSLLAAYFAYRYYA